MSRLSCSSSITVLGLRLYGLLLGCKCACLYIPERQFKSLMNTSHYNSLLLRYSEESYCVAQRLRGILVVCVNVIMQLAMRTPTITALFI